MAGTMRRGLFISHVIYHLQLLLITQGTAKEFLSLCYFNSTAVKRIDYLDAYDIGNLDPNLCTHLVYAFGKIDPGTKGLVVRKPSVDSEDAEHSKPPHTSVEESQIYDTFNSYREDNTHLKTLLSIGGEQNDSRTFQALTENDNTAKEFAENTVTFLRNRGFDGLDVYWKPSHAQANINFTLLLYTLRKAFDEEKKATDKERLILTLAGPAERKDIDKVFKTPKLASFVDFVNLKTFDYTFGNTTAFYSPLFSRKDKPSLSTNWTVHYWKEKGLPFNQMIVGVSGLGRIMELEDPQHFWPGAATLAKSGGTLSYLEVCYLRKSQGTEQYFDNEQRVPYLVNGSNWVGYEDAESLAIKVTWMKGVGVAGIMFCTLDLDDSWDQVCGQGPYPMLHAIKTAIAKERVPSTITIDPIVGGQPGNPAVSARPGNPAVSSKPGIPAVSRMPGTPGVSSKPGIPAVSRMPGTPGVSSKPGIPAVSSKPVNPAVSRMPGTPAVSSKPGIPVVSGMPGIPVDPSKVQNALADGIESHTLRASVFGLCCCVLIAFIPWWH